MRWLLTNLPEIGAFIGSAMAAFFAKRSAKETKTPNGKTLGERVEGLTEGQDVLGHKLDMLAASYLLNVKHTEEVWTTLERSVLKGQDVKTILEGLIELRHIQKQEG